MLAAVSCPKLAERAFEIDVEQASPCDEPTLVVNGLDLILSKWTSSVVVLSNFSVMRHSSRPNMFLVFSSSFCRSMMLKALDISISILFR